MNYSLPGSFVRGIFQARILEWVAISSSRGIFPTQGLIPRLLQLLHCREILYLSATGEAHLVFIEHLLYASFYYMLGMIPDSGNSAITSTHIFILTEHPSGFENTVKKIKM